MITLENFTSYEEGREKLCHIRSWLIRQADSCELALSKARDDLNKKGINDRTRRLREQVYHRISGLQGEYMAASVDVKTLIIESARELLTFYVNYRDKLPPPLDMIARSLPNQNNHFRLR